MLNGTILTSAMPVKTFFTKLTSYASNSTLSQTVVFGVAALPFPAMISLLVVRSFARALLHFLECENQHRQDPISGHLNTGHI